MFTAAFAVWRLFSKPVGLTFGFLATDAVARLDFRQQESRVGFSRDRTFVALGSSPALTLVLNV